MVYNTNSDTKDSTNTDTKTKTKTNTNTNTDTYTNTNTDTNTNADTNTIIYQGANMSTLLCARAVCGCEGVPCCTWL